MKTLRIITIILFLLSLAVYLGVSYRYNNQLDRVSPAIRCETEVLEVSVNADDSDLLTGVTATDNRDGDLTDRIMIQGISRLLTENTVRVTYVVMDSSNNIASCTRIVRYTDYAPPRLALNAIPVYTTELEQNALSVLKETLIATDVKDGDLSGDIRIIANSIDVTLENTYTLTLEVTNSLGDSEVVPLTIVIDDEGAANPLVTLKEYITYVNVGSSFEPKSCILTLNGSPYSGVASGLTIDSQVDTSIPGTYQVRYKYHSFTVYQTVVVR